MEAGPSGPGPRKSLGRLEMISGRPRLFLAGRGPGRAVSEAGPRRLSRVLERLPISGELEISHSNLLIDKKNSGFEGQLFPKWKWFAERARASPDVRPCALAGKGFRPPRAELSQRANSPQRPFRFSLCRNPSSSAPGEGFRGCSQNRGVCQLRIRTSSFAEKIWC